MGGGHVLVPFMQLSEFLVFVFGYVLVLLYSITTLRLEHDWSLLPSLLCTVRRQLTCISQNIIQFDPLKFL